MPATARAGSTTPIPAPATLGLLGGGQLGRFFVQAAHELGSVCLLYTSRCV